MHRNTFINAPALLKPTMQFRNHENIYFGGQITGVEGYVGNIATGLIAAINLSRRLENESEWVPDKETMVGALCHYVTHTEPKDFQPMKANFGILPALEQKIKGKQQRKQAYAERARYAMQKSLAKLHGSPVNVIQDM